MAWAAMIPDGWLRETMVMLLPEWIFWPLTVVAFAVSAAALWRWRRRADVTRDVERACGGCGYVTRALPSSTCPECGGDLNRLGHLGPADRRRQRRSRFARAAAWTACFFAVGLPIIIAGFLLRLTWHVTGSGQLVARFPALTRPDGAGAIFVNAHSYDLWYRGHPEWRDGPPASFAFHDDRLSVYRAAGPAGSLQREGEPIASTSWSAGDGLSGVGLLELVGAVTGQQVDAARLDAALTDPAADAWLGDAVLDLAWMMNWTRGDEGGEVRQDPELAEALGVNGYERFRSDDPLLDRLHRQQRLETERRGLTGIDARGITVRSVSDERVRPVGWQAIALVTPWLALWLLGLVLLVRAGRLRPRVG